MLRQAAFEGENALLKGGLHCHTTRSDGKGTPEEVIAMHAQHGYDFLALTDHRTYNYKDYLPESGVLIIPGMEFDRPSPIITACTASILYGSAPKSLKILTSRISPSSAAMCRISTSSSSFWTRRTATSS